MVDSSAEKSCRCLGMDIRSQARTEQNVEKEEKERDRIRAEAGKRPNGQTVQNGRAFVTVMERVRRDLCRLISCWVNVFRSMGSTEHLSQRNEPRGTSE